MRDQHPQTLHHRWTSYTGTGYNIFGRQVLYGHGRPGAMLQISFDSLNAYVASLDDASKLELYHLFASDEQPRIEGEIRKIVRWSQRTRQ